jgi:hypothetical protein
MSFTYPYELAILRSRLESENIECFVKDELTVQVNPFYSNAIGGIKLQVRESDLQRAIVILKETRYLDDVEIKPSKLTVKLNNWTLRIPFLKRLQLEFRLIIIVTFLITLTIITR